MIKTLTSPKKYIPLFVLFGLAFMVSTFRVTMAPTPAQADGAAADARPQIFIRFRMAEPAMPGQKVQVVVNGFLHKEPFGMPGMATTMVSGAWSDWLDLRDWPWHGKMGRSGGVAEWPSLKLTALRTDTNDKIKDIAMEVQLADQPADAGVVLSFTERSASNTIGFLVPHPLREHKDEFETGTQMTQRHWQWAKDATGGQPITLKNFQVITALWGDYDPAIEKQDIATLRMLGFNVIGNASAEALQAAEARTYGTTSIYVPASVATTRWQDYVKNNITPLLDTPAGKAQSAFQYAGATHFVISDEVAGLDTSKSFLQAIEYDPAKLDKEFQDYLQSHGVTDADLGKPISQITFPAEIVYAPTLPQKADLPARRLAYHAAKFGQWWSARSLRHMSELIRGPFPGMDTEILMPSHGFMGTAWGAPYMGMSYRMLDYFQIGAQRSVSQLSAEDWLGLNHMYGSAFTWTGGQTFGYFNALLRSAAQQASPPTTVAPDNKPMMLRGLITPSDDQYLRLKAYSSLAQGAKSFFFWTYGPTYIGTENYWSDLRSEYDGVVKLNRALAQSESTLLAAQPVRDPVAIVYSVSHDLWHTTNPAGFVEKRLLWHALRHLQVQPDFLPEEALAAGQLKNYKVLYLTDWNLSRAASSAIDKWVQSGGVLYLSAGAATRDEFDEPYLPPFARAVWPDDAAQKIQRDPVAHTYGERDDLPAVKPLTTANIQLGTQTFSLPVLGARLILRDSKDKPTATFADGTPAGRTLAYGKGQIVALGFLPFLAYGQGANFKPVTLEEKWPAEPRALAQLPLSLAGVTPVAKADVPVVETGLLNGPQGAALVLANYTYEPIAALTVDVKLSHPVKSARSTQGVKVQMQKTKDGVRLTLPLAETDIVLLSR